MASLVQAGDMGVDGRIFPVGTKPDAGGLYFEDWFSIQVKQADKVGRPDIDTFGAVMEREALAAANAVSSSPLATAAKVTTECTPASQARQYAACAITSSVARAKIGDA